VDSAEADQVGRQGIRFCAYDSLVSSQGVRHYHTTLVCVEFFSFSFLVPVIAGCGSYRTVDLRLLA
jgi:hypothetical protein